MMEEREEYMVSPNGDGQPILRTAHFLKPSVTSIDGPIPKLPSHSLSSKSTISKLGKLPLKVSFNGWRNPQQNWESWVDRLLPTHGSTWKKAGIYEAIMASTYRIRRSDKLVFGVTEKWCSKTNTFIFPWGEATITLEDMMILGGYSVLGDSVLSPLETQELKELEEKLNLARLRIARTRAKRASQQKWMKHFMEEDERELEHEAFLSLWLSRFVFPNAFDVIRKHVLPIAVRLAKGTRIALAPAVLASIYRDLSLLKAAIVASNSTKFERNEENILALTLWAPLQFVQIWVWERIVTLRPKPDLIEEGKPRIARWHMKDSSENVKLDLNTLGECFQWRPYTSTVQNWLLPKFYVEMEVRVSVKSDLDIEFESFARCLRVCELVGIDCIEQYLPHRVAMQYGIDQDIPGHVARCNESPETAWNSYSRPITDANLYIPSRLFESDITSRYEQWWKNSVLPKRRPKNSKRLLGDNKKKKEDNDASVPLGYPPECSKGDSVEEDEQTLRELLHSNRLERILKKRKGTNNACDAPGSLHKSIRMDNGRCLSEAQLLIGSSSTAENEADGKLDSTMKPGDEIMDTEVSMVGSDDAIKDLTSSKELLVNSKEMKGNNYCNVPEINILDWNLIKETKLARQEMLEVGKEQIGVDKAGDGNCLSDAQSKSPSTLTADNGIVRHMETSKQPGDGITYVEISSGGSDNEMKDQNESATRSPESVSNEEHEIPGLELEVQLNKLGRIIARLKAEHESRFRSNFTT